MNLKMAGIDFTMADIEKRQCFSFTKKAMADAMEQMKKKEEIRGCVFLSTCNRMELWLSLREGARLMLPDFLCALKGLSAEQYKKYLVVRENEEAVEHLFYLSAGMKSQIVGEDQILTQVKEALAFAREQEGTDRILEVLFRMAVTAAKQVKTKVSMDKANFSAAHHAVSFLKSRGVEFTRKNCLVIGNGEMGKLTAQALMEEGADVTVTVRQYRSGVVNIPRGAKRIDYGARYLQIEERDLVFSATASPNLTITREGLEGSEKGKDFGKGGTRKKQIFVDLAVPRDMEPSIAALEGIQYYDMDSLPTQSQSEKMRIQYRKAEQILAKEIQKFWDWQNCKNLVPRIQEIGSKTGNELVWRMGKYIKNLNLSQQERELFERQLEEAAGKVVNRMLFELRDQTEQETLQKTVETLEQLYQIGKH